MYESLYVGSCICEACDFRTVFTYDTPPAGETQFEFSRSDAYHREILQCSQCRHFVSHTEMDLAALYDYDYVSGTYRDADGVRQAFARITDLPPGSSDNLGRVKRVTSFGSEYLERPREEGCRPSVLDVGSGLGVFPHRMQEAGWECLALDTDERLTRHIRDDIGVDAVCAPFGDHGDLGRFDVVTFNKVLEHVEDPITMLRHSASHLEEGGFVYVEVPDGEVAARDGSGREEFFIEHLHVFSFVSLTLLAQKAGFEPILIERLQEPSMKYTLRSFLRPLT